MTNTDWIAGTGVACCLVAFVLSGLKLLKQQSVTYCLLNIIGGGLSCYAACLIMFVPFIIMEGVWAIAAAFGLVEVLRKPTQI